MKIFKKILFIFGIIIFIIVAFFAYFYFTLDDLDVNRELKFGATFTPKRSNDLGLDWRENYLALLDDLGVKRLRLAAYWNRIEEIKGEYDFSELDWMIGEAEKRDVKIILVVGRKTPGWPECHIPSWARENPNSKIQIPKSDQDKYLLNYMRETIKRYKDSPSVWAWQVENEPFLRFGICAQEKEDFLKREIDLIRSLDDKPIILTASGEFGKWWKVAPYGDILGTTLYRSVYHHRLGYITYPIPPVFFRLKALLVEKWTEPEDIIVIELQGEPWVEDPPINDAPLEEQYITMSPQKFREMLEYIRRTDFNEFYLWGSEWWYWMKLEGNNEIWEIVKDLFNN